MKRVVDVSLGIVLATAALPVILATAVASAVMFRAWPFFVQHRVGRDGETFRFVKLRTLPPDAPRYADKYTVGRLQLPGFASALRRRKIDELPQLLLVPLGRMSLVGPRPEMPSLHAILETRFAAARTHVRPGCTGLWQISDRCHLLIGEAPEFDEFYLRHHCVRLDVWILVRTIGVLLGARQITLADVPTWAVRTRSGRPASDTATVTTFEAAEP